MRFYARSGEWILPGDPGADGESRPSLTGSHRYFVSAPFLGTTSTDTLAAYQGPPTGPETTTPYTHLRRYQCGTITWRYNYAMGLLRIIAILSYFTPTVHALHYAS